MINLFETIINHRYYKWLLNSKSSTTTRCLLPHPLIYNFFKPKRKYLVTNTSWFVLRKINIINPQVISLHTNTPRLNHTKNKNHGLIKWTVEKRDRKHNKQKKDCMNRCFWIAMSISINKESIKPQNLCLQLMEESISQSIHISSWKITRI